MAKNLIDWIKSQMDQNPEKDGFQLVSPQMKQNADNAVGGIKKLFTPDQTYAKLTTDQKIIRASAQQNALFGVGPALLDAGANRMAESSNPVVSRIGKIARVPTGFIAPDKERQDLIVRGIKDPASVDQRDARLLADSALMSVGGLTSPVQKIAKGGGALKVINPIKEFRAAAKEAVPKESNTTMSKVGDAYDYVTQPKVEVIRKKLGDRLFEPFKRDVVDFINQKLAEGTKYSQSVRSQMEGLNIAPGSRESALVEMYGTGKITRAKLTQELGPEGAAKIINADKWFRNTYNQAYDMINAAAKENGSQALPKKEFYYHSNNKPDSSMIDSLMGGLSPGGTTQQKSAGIFKTQGEKTNYDAVSGMISYLDSVKRAAFTDAVESKAKPYLAALKKNKADPTAIDAIKAYRDSVLGVKKAGGIGGAIEDVTAPMRAAKVVGNPGTILSQVFNFGGGIGRDPKAFFKGLLSGEAKQAAGDSPYLTAIGDRVSLKLTKGVGAKAMKVAGIPLQEANNFTARTMWKSFYQKALDTGVKDAMQFADDSTAALMGDRRLGALPAVADTPLGRVLTAFTLENQAGINLLMKDIGQKKAGAVIGTLVAWHLANKGIEAVGQGYTPFFDPVQSIMDSAELWNGSDRKDPNKVKAVSRIIAEMTKLTPALQASVFTLYKGAEMLSGDSGIVPKTQDIFGSEDPTWANVGSLYNPAQGITRRITGNKYVDAGINVAGKFIPGVNPVTKAVQAKQSIDRGAAVSKDGSVMYKMPTDKFNQARAIVFGQSSTPQAREYFNSDYSRPLSENQTKAYATLSPDEKSKFVDSARSAKKTELSGKASGVSGTKAEKAARMSVINAKAELGAPLTPEEINLKYLDKYDSMPTGSNYEKTIKYSEGFKQASAIIQDQYASDATKAEVLKKTGVSQEEIQYRQIASGNDNVQTDYAIEELSKLSGEERDAFLLRGRSVVDNQSLLSDTVVGKLVDEGAITKAESLALKAVKYVRDNSYTGKDAIKMGDSTYKPVVKKTSGTGKKIKITASSLGGSKSRKLSSPKIKISSPGSFSKTSFKIKSPVLQSGKDWRKIKLKA